MQATIVTIPGDGIGVEVVAEGVKVLKVVAEKYDHTFTFEHHLIGGCAIDATGEPLPAVTLDACKKADAVLMGAVGGPKWSDPSAKVRPEQGLLAIRKGLGLYANLRPVQIFPQLRDASPLRPERLQGVDLVVVRELTGGIYFGERKEATDGEADFATAYDTMIYSAPEIERIARKAFELARLRRSKVTSVDKANVLACSRLWRKTVVKVAADYPDVALDHMLVDAAAMHLMRRPSDFDVILTGNMFGDILTDEASQLAGSMGMLASASLGEGATGLYEPIHGSAPDITGMGIANPLATILSIAMLLRYSLGLNEEAIAVEKAVAAVVAAGYRTKDIYTEGMKLVNTEEMGNTVCGKVQKPCFLK